MPNIEEANKKIRKFGNFHDNRAAEYKAIITSANQSHESIKYIIEMLTQQGIRETESATTMDNLQTKVLPILEAISFLILDRRIYGDSQGEYPNKKVDIYDFEYMQEVHRLMIAISDLNAMRSHFGAVVGPKAYWLMGIFFDDKPLDVVSNMLIEELKDIRLRTMQILKRQELP